MDIENLVKMANQIGAFFVTMPDYDQASDDLANHIKRSWEPRMRKALLAHIANNDNTGLDPFVLESMSRHLKLLA